MKSFLSETNKVGREGSSASASSTAQQGAAAQGTSASRSASSASGSLASSTTQQGGAAAQGTSASASGSLASSASHLRKQLNSKYKQQATAIEDLNVILTNLLQPQQLSDPTKFGALKTLTEQYQQQCKLIRKIRSDFKKQLEALVKKAEQNAIRTLSNMADGDDSSRPAPTA